MESHVRQCRLCSGVRGPLIAPCLCTGTSHHIHPACLQRLRVMHSAQNFTNCPTCGFQYRLRETHPMLNSSTRLRLLLLRDLLTAMLLFQALVLLFAAILYWADQDRKNLVHTFHARNEFGVYYAAGNVIFLVAIAVVTMLYALCRGYHGERCDDCFAQFQCIWWEGWCHPAFYCFAPTDKPAETINFIGCCPCGNLNSLCCCMCCGTGANGGPRRPLSGIRRVFVLGCLAALFAASGALIGLISLWQALMRALSRRLHVLARIVRTQEHVVVDLDEPDSHAESRREVRYITRERTLARII
eukprot:m.64198 g.64198  ORF g.64198 m.64198 type:complete len:301 (+) comp7503_c0_seq4:108-1010(+)